MAWIKQMFLTTLSIWLAGQAGIILAMMQRPPTIDQINFQSIHPRFLGGLVLVLGLVLLIGWVWAKLRDR